MLGEFLMINIEEQKTSRCAANDLIFAQPVDRGERDEGLYWLRENAKEYVKGQMGSEC
jgi:hypothetical protein